MAPRSGKSAKFTTKELIQIVINHAIFFLVLLSNKEAKICVVMRVTSKENWKIVANKSYLIKNIIYKEEKLGMPVFFVTKASIFRETAIPPSNPHLNFSAEEKTEIKTIIISECYPQEVNLPATSATTQNTTILTLTEFLTTNSKNIKDDQFVEVFLSFQLMTVL